MSELCARWGLIIKGNGSTPRASWYPWLDCLIHTSYSINSTYLKRGLHTSDAVGVSATHIYSLSLWLRVESTEAGSGLIGWERVGGRPLVDDGLGSMSIGDWVCLVTWIRSSTWIILITDVCESICVNLSVVVHLHGRRRRICFHSGAGCNWRRRHDSLLLVPSTAVVLHWCELIGTRYLVGDEHTSSFYVILDRIKCLIEC